VFICGFEFFSGIAVPMLKLLGGLRRFGAAPMQVGGSTVRAVLEQSSVPDALLFPGDELNRDIEVLVNGRNISFLSGLQTPLSNDDRVTVFLHGARGYPGG
jgi:molybdopterin converting factor small subunit